MVAHEAKAGANTGPQATVRTLNAVFDQAEASLARTDTLEGVAQMYTTADKRGWTFRAKCCLRARDMKTGYHDDSVAKFAELVGMKKSNAHALIADYELYGCEQSSKRLEDAEADAEEGEPLPRSVYRVANEGTTDTKTAITVLADYRDRAAAGAAPSVRQFAAELQMKQPKAVPVAEMVPFTGTDDAATDEGGGTEADDFNVTERRRAFLGGLNDALTCCNPPACCCRGKSVGCMVSTGPAALPANGKVRRSALLWPGLLVRPRKAKV